MKTCECPGCGATITFSGREGTVRCEYCDTAVTVPEERLQPPAQERRSLAALYPNRHKSRETQRNSAREEAVNRELGKIRFIGDSYSFSKRDAEELAAELREMGFLNVRCESMHDLTVNSASRDGRVASVNVDGGVFANYNWYYAAATIVIHYHGF